VTKCKHCGKEIKKVWEKGGWYHIKNGQVWCSKIRAEPEEESK
jgi:hypothetical protein